MARLVQGIGLAVGGIVGLPWLASAFSPVVENESQELWQPVGPLAGFPVGSIQAASVTLPRGDWTRSLQEKGVYVWRNAPGEVVVFSRDCTDLGCPVNWDPKSRCFLCPCHGGIFNMNGERLAGPPKRALYRYATRVRDGILEVDLRSVPVVV